MKAATTHTMTPSHGLITHEDYIAVCNLNAQLATIPTYRRPLFSRNGVAGRLAIFLRTTSMYAQGQA